MRAGRGCKSRGGRAPASSIKKCHWKYLVAMQPLTRERYTTPGATITEEPLPHGIDRLHVTRRCGYSTAPKTGSLTWFRKWFHDPDITQTQSTEVLKADRCLLCTAFVISEGHQSSHETVQVHGTLMSGRAAIGTPHTKRYWAAVQRRTPHNIGPHTYTCKYTHAPPWLPPPPRRSSCGRRTPRPADASFGQLLTFNF